MKIFLITYDLNAPGKNYENVINAIKTASNGTWCSFWRSSFLICSNHNANEIVDQISPFLDSNDRLFVVEVTSHYQGWLSKKEWEYIHDNIF